MTEWNVLLPAQIDPAGPESITDFAEFTSIDHYADRQELLTDVGKFDAIIVRTTTLDEDFIENADRLKLIAKHGAGLDNVDIQAATKRGIPVCNTPGVNANAVAEHTITLLLATRRHLVAADAETRNGQWNRHAFESREIRGDRLGLFGVGNIGQRVAELATGLGLRCLGYDPYVPQEDIPGNIELTKQKTEFFERSDILSIHAPLTSETHGAISTEELTHLPDSGVVINTSRGGILDEDALYRALVEEELTGAGLDVFANEPPGNSPLFELESVIVTPHIAGVTVEAMRAMSTGAADNIRTFFNGELPESTVNPDAIK